MNGQDFISIITINYKQSAVTNELIGSLSAMHWKQFELIIVDNNSGADEIRKLNTKPSFVKLIKSPVNKGFAGGNNLGIVTAKGKYILLLNNDTEVEADFMAPLVKLMKSDSSIGAVSPKIKFYDDKNTVQYAGFSKMNKLSLRMHAIGSHQTDNGQFSKLSETNFAHGCALMFRKSMLGKTGLMPEEYFLYYEEHDWSTAIKRAGYKIYFQPLSVVYHKESMSVQKNSPLKTYFLNRNRILYMLRNFSWPWKAVSLLYIVCISIPKNVISLLIRSDIQHLRAYTDALSWHLNHKTKSRWNLQ